MNRNFTDEELKEILDLCKAALVMTDTELCKEYMTLDQREYFHKRDVFSDIFRLVNELIEMRKTKEDNLAGKKNNSIRVSHKMAAGHLTFANLDDIMSLWEKNTYAASPWNFELITGDDTIEVAIPLRSLTKEELDELYKDG